MLCIFGIYPCKLALPAEGSDQEVSEAQMVIAWEARAAQRSGVGFKVMLAAEREGSLSTGKNFLGFRLLGLTYKACRTII